MVHPHQKSKIYIFEPQTQNLSIPPHVKRPESTQNEIPKHPTTKILKVKNLELGIGALTIPIFRNSEKKIKDPRCLSTSRDQSTRATQIVESCHSGWEKRSKFGEHGKDEKYMCAWKTSSPR